MFKFERVQKTPEEEKKILKNIVEKLSNFAGVRDVKLTENNELIITMVDNGKISLKEHLFPELMQFKPTQITAREQKLTTLIKMVF